MNRLLRFIVDYQDAHGGVSPSYVEMMAATGLASRSSLHRTLKRLVLAGLLRRLPARARALEVTARARAMLYPQDRRRYRPQEDALRAVGWRLSQAAPLTRIE